MGNRLHRTDDCSGSNIEFIFLTIICGRRYVVSESIVLCLDMTRFEAC